MSKKYMYCPVHANICLESAQTIKNFLSPKQGEVNIFHCPTCKRYYFNAEGYGPSGTESSGKKVKSTGEEVFVTTSKVYANQPVVQPKKKTNSNFEQIMSTSIFAKTSVKGVSGKEKQTIQKPPLPTTNEVRIHTYKKREADQKLLSSFAHLQVEYSTLSAINDINDLIKKSFPSNIDQTCVVRNMTFMGANGFPIKRVEIYNKNSSFLKKRLPENTFLAFAGKLNSGEFWIDELRVISNPIMKKDDSEHKFVFLYDGPSHPNALWALTEKVADQPEDLKGELADWSAYLDWKRQLAEMRVQGIKYIGIRFDTALRQMRILAVTEGEDEYKKFRRALRRNEVSAFSNVYSLDPWKFVFNNNDIDYKNDFGIELLFLSEGNHYSRYEIGSEWDSLRDYFKKYAEKKESADIQYLVNGITKNYDSPYFVELIFELSKEAMETIERSLRRTGSLPNNLEESLAEEFYGDGYLATSQIGDFALLRRLKMAVFDLAKGKAASQGLDSWLFDITKARTPDSLVKVDHWQNKTINDKQKRAVEKILSTPDVCLIQGPPGTGKTTVIAEAIYQTVIRNKRVLVASQANLAVDNALERLISNPKIRAIRLGSAKKIDSSVNNITEANVLESFYTSIVDFIDNKYLSKWREYDEIVESCDSDYEKVERLESESEKIGFEVILLNKKLEQVSIRMNSEQSFLIQNSIKMEKVSLSMLKAFIGGGIEEIELALRCDAVISIWNTLEPQFVQLQVLGLWISRVGIDVTDIETPGKLEQANDILKHIVLNIRRANALERKISGEISFGGESSELETLKIREQVLKEKVLKEMTPDVLQEWKDVNEQIQKLAASGGGLVDEEMLLFGRDESERASITQNKEQMAEILKNASPVLQSIGIDLLTAIDNASKQNLAEQEAIEVKSQSLIEERREIQEDLSILEAKQLKIHELIQDILHKYDSDRASLKEKISEKKDAADDYAGVDRNEWEEIFTAFESWVDDIPDYAQEKDLFLKTFINGCNVVGVSCTENARTLNEAGFDDFDLVIIDEVSKATPPELLIPMLRGRKIVLVGDHRQLPPLFNEHEKTYQEVAEQQELMIQENPDSMIVSLTMDDFKKYKDMVTSSLFQKYFENGSDDIKETLTYQYRMHKDIMNIVNQFYDGYLKDGNEERYETGCKEHNLYIHSTSGTAMIVPERHAYWFDSSELEGEPIYEQRKIGSTSAENVYEAYAIIELLKKMEVEYANQAKQNSVVTVGVISFYYDQVSMLRNMVRKESFHAIDVEINTVDRFQGKEKEIVIVSLVRNVKKARHNIDSHIAAFQRINVAFSRAQNLLVIVGAKDMYAPQPVAMTDMYNGTEKEVMVYKNIIEMMDQNGTLFSCEELLSSNLAGEVFSNINVKGDVEE